MSSISCRDRSRFGIGGCGSASQPSISSALRLPTSSDGNGGLASAPVPSGSTITEVGKPLRDLDVRKAIAAALPFDQLLERPYLGLAQQMRTTVAPAYVGYDRVSKV
jgi:hypothetical protein